MTKRRFLYLFLLVSALLVIGILSNALAVDHIEVDLTKEWLVFHCMTNDLISYMYISSPDGDSLQRIIGPAQNIFQRQIQSVTQPTWSPQNELLAFIFNRALAISKINGSDLTIVREDTSFSSPSWSPDGEWLVFASNRAGIREWNIFKLNLATREIIQLTSRNFSWAPVWSPANNLIAFSFGRSIYLMGIDGSDQRELIITNIQQSRPTWSPDGQWLAFVYRDDNGDSLYRINIDTQEIHRITPNLHWITAPAWSPDGEWIVFSAMQNNYGTLYKVRLDGTELQGLVSISGCHTTATNWVFPIAENTPN